MESDHYKVHQSGLVVFGFALIGRNWSRLLQSREGDAGVVADKEEDLVVVIDQHDSCVGFQAATKTVVEQLSLIHI